MENQSAVFNFLEKYLMGPLGKLSQFKFVQAIAAAGMASIPFSIIGSMFLVLNVLPTTIPALSGFFDATITPLTSLYMQGNYVTVGALALYFVISTGYNYTKLIAEEDGTNLDSLNGALLSLFAFLLAVPELIFENGIFTTVSNESTIAGWAIGSGPNRFGASGVFTAIIMAALAVRIYHLCVRKNWTIKMPEVVPLGVSRSFTALIPAAIVGIVVLVINGTLVVMGTDVFKAIAIPFSFVTGIVNTWWGIIIIYFLIHALWIVGVHGATIIGSFITPVALTNMAENINGADHVLAGAFQNSFVTIGGSGATLGLIIMMVFLARSEQLKAIGKAAIAPSLFNINEPLIFGAPIIYNPYLAVPFILAPTVTAMIAYAAIKTSLILPVIVEAPWPLPIGIQAFFATGGDWRAIVLAIVSALVATAIYFPFFKMYDGKLYKEEQARAAKLD